MHNLHNHQNTSILAWVIGSSLVLLTCAMFFAHILEFLLYVLLVNVISQGIYFWVEGSLFSYSFSQDPESRFLLYLLSMALPFIGGYQWVAKLKMNYRSKLLRGLAASIAHEMRNPLAQLHGSLQLMQRQLSQIDGAKPVVNYHVNHAQKVIDQALQQIDITLDSIKNKPIDPGKFQRLSARAVVAEAVAEYAYEETEQAESISVTGEDFKLMAEPVMFKYVIFNLLQNALWFSKTLPNGRIDITLKTTFDKNLIEVRDNGSGITATAIPHLFDNFYTAGKHGGTGLGLPYCKRAMLAFGGDITCESELHQYTVFTLSFPVISSQQPEQNKYCISELKKFVPSSRVPVRPELLSEKTVLIADDDQLNRAIVKEVLHGWDIDCLEAGNGQEALDILSNNHCDLIITDMQMPLMSGLELVQAVRSRERKAGDASIPIITLTAERNSAVKAAILLGANDHLSKPITAEKALPKLAQWLLD
jgi:signal transduction histidine kinase